MTATKKSDTRIHYLDSWRGIAAVSVLLFHLMEPFHNLFNGSDVPVKMARIAFDGTDWVSFFFVLSGFALSYGYIISGRALSVSDFYIKRILRIYPLYIFALMLCALEHQGHYSGLLFLREALLFTTSPSLLLPGWSLSIEICCSILMPLVIILALSNKYQFWLVCICVLFIYNTKETTLNSFHGYLFHFFLGTGMALLFKESKTNVHSIINRSLDTGRVLLILITGYILFTLRFTTEYIHAFYKIDFIIRLFADTFNMNRHQFFHTLSAIVSFIIILTTLRSDFLQKVLSIRPFLFIGKISFSIYLMHWSVINFSFPRLVILMNYLKIYNHYMVAVLITSAILFLVLSISYLTYICIEKPFMNISQRVIKSSWYITYKTKFNL